MASVASVLSIVFFACATSSFVPQATAVAAIDDDVAGIHAQSVGVTNTTLMMLVMMHLHRFLR
ncbi:MAG: hypothetical protein ACREQO_10965 [Candidatus Binatia bacterium]